MCFSSNAVTPLPQGQPTETADSLITDIEEFKRNYAYLKLSTLINDYLDMTDEYHGGTL